MLCTTQQNNRIVWLDVAKGITMILVIVGHTINNHFIRGAIFSFHMPLFFILSGFSVRYSENIHEWLIKAKKTFKKLVIPGVLLYIIRFWLLDLRDSLCNKTMFLYNCDYFLQKFKEMILSIIWSSGVPFTIGKVEIGAIGIPWFLIVLFFAKTLVDFFQLKLNDRELVKLFCALASIGFVISNYIWLPFSFDITLTVMIYIYFGTIMRNINLKEKQIIKLFISIVIWGITLFIEYYFTHSYAELAFRRYTMFPLCYVTALAGTLVLIYISMYIENHILVRKYLGFIGCNSMLLLCIHMMDSIWQPLLLKFLVNEYFVCIVSLTIDLILLFLIKRILNYRKVCLEEYLKKQ